MNLFWSCWSWNLFKFCNITRLKSISHPEIDAKILLVTTLEITFFRHSRLASRFHGESAMRRKSEERSGCHEGLQLTRSFSAIFSLFCRLWRLYMYKTQDEFPYPFAAIFAVSLSGCCYALWPQFLHYIPPRLFCWLRILLNLNEEKESGGERIFLSCYIIFCLLCMSVEHDETNFSKNFFSSLTEIARHILRMMSNFRFFFFFFVDMMKLCFVFVFIIFLSACRTTSLGDMTLLAKGICCANKADEDRFHS